MSGVYVGTPWQTLSAQRARVLSGDEEKSDPVTDPRWISLISQLAKLSPFNKLELVQSALSLFPYQKDMENFGKPDHWASVQEFLRHGGDCEDFALAKLRALVAAGFATENLRLILVEQAARGEDHAILVARVDGVDYVLDSQTPEVRPVSLAQHYRPVFSISVSAVYNHQVDQQRTLSGVLTAH